MDTGFKCDILEREGFSYQVARFPSLFMADRLWTSVRLERHQTRAPMVLPPVAGFCNRL
jgi:hypothetical protein